MCSVYTSNRVIRVGGLEQMNRAPFTTTQELAMTSRQFQTFAIRRQPFWGQALSTGFVPPLLLIGVVLGGFFWSVPPVP